MEKILDNGGEWKGDNTSNFLTAFSVFSKLAFEIRDMIWVVAAEDADARVVEVVYNPHARWRSKEFPSKSLVPALMHACSESRAVAKRCYADFPMYVDTQVFKRTFINWEKDFFFPTTWHLRHFVESSPVRAKHLRISIQNFATRSSEIHGHELSWLVYSPYRDPVLPNIKKLILIDNFYDHRSRVRSGPLRLKESAKTQYQVAGLC